ncbi:MAG: hypothetical protein WCG25_00410 [bacterium]
MVSTLFTFCHHLPHDLDVLKSVNSCSIIFLIHVCLSIHIWFFIALISSSEKLCFQVCNISNNCS